MALNLDDAVGIYQHTLRLRAQRTELLAANIANADTPNYKAKDIDFQAALKQAMNASGGDSTMKTTHPGHISAAGQGGSSGLDDFVRYRTPYQPAVDGNTVESHVEQAAFARNAVEYQATLKFLEGRFSGITKAIKGGE